MKRRKRLRDASVRTTAETPLVSCLMVSRGNLFPAQMAITCYQRQTYPNRELVIVSAQPNSAVSEYVADLDDPSIRFFQSPPMPLGELRNRSVAAANGLFLCTWDDDDLYSRDRIELQVGGCLRSGAAAHFLDRVLIWWPERRLLAISAARPWENTMMVRREALPRYPSLPLREDTHVVQELQACYKVATLDEPELYCYVVNSQNSCDTSHFERLFETADWIYPDYDAELVRLTARYPIRSYADSMLARHLSVSGEISRPRHRPPLIVCSGQYFGQEDLQVDGLHFKDCTFDRTRLTYLGGLFPVFENCEMDRIKILFLGSAANTVDWLVELENAGIIVKPSALRPDFVAASPPGHIAAGEKA